MSITHDGFQVTNFKIPYLDDPKPYDDHKEIDKFLNEGSYSVATGMEYQEYLSEYAFVMKHCVKKTNPIEFIKCMDNPKCNHCEQKPIQASSFMEFIKQPGGNTRSIMSRPLLHTSTV